MHLKRYWAVQSHRWIFSKKRCTDQGILAYNTNIVTLANRFTAGRRRYNVSFQQMIQVNEESGNRRPIIVMFNKPKKAGGSDSNSSVTIEQEKDGNSCVVFQPTPWLHTCCDARLDHGNRCRCKQPKRRHHLAGLDRGAIKIVASVVYGAFESSYPRRHRSCGYETFAEVGMKNGFSNKAARLMVVMNSGVRMRSIVRRFDCR